LEILERRGKKAFLVRIYQIKSLILEENEVLLLKISGRKDKETNKGGSKAKKG
jgi:hypothetical protein